MTAARPKDKKELQEREDVGVFRASRCTSSLTYGSSHNLKSMSDFVSRRDLRSRSSVRGWWTHTRLIPCRRHFLFHTKTFVIFSHYFALLSICFLQGEVGLPPTQRAEGALGRTILLFKNKGVWCV